MHLSQAPVTDYPTVVAELTLSGMTAGEIAAHLGVSEKTVQRYRRKTNVPVPQGRPLRVDPGKVTQLTNDGMSAAQIGQQLGVSERSINGHRRKNGDVSPEKNSGRMRERLLSGYITPSHSLKDRRAERDILQELFEKDMGLVRMFFDTHTTGAITEERANALASFSNGDFRRRLMSQNGQTLKKLGTRAVKIKVFAEQRAELNPVFAAEGVTPIRTSIEGNTEFVISLNVLHRLRATQKTLGGQGASQL